MMNEVDIYERQGFGNQSGFGKQPALLIVDFVNGRMPAYVDTGLNLVHVDDCARGHLLAFERGKIGERYILGGEDLTLREILLALGRITGRPAPGVR